MQGKPGWSIRTVCAEDGEKTIANRKNNCSRNAVFIKETFWADAR